MANRLLLIVVCGMLASCQTTTVVDGPDAPAPTGGRVCRVGQAGACQSASQYCFAVPLETGALPITGNCRSLPQACTLEYHAVCGVDGRTYGNACDAAGHGINVSREGACIPGPA